MFPVQGAPTGEKADEEDYKKGWWSGMEGHGLFIERGIGCWGCHDPQIGGLGSQGVVGVVKY